MAKESTNGISHWLEKTLFSTIISLKHSRHRQPFHFVQSQAETLATDNGSCSDLRPDGNEIIGNREGLFGNNGNFPTVIPYGEGLDLQQGQLADIRDRALDFYLRAFETTGALLDVSNSRIAEGEVIAGRQKEQDCSHKAYPFRMFHWNVRSLNGFCFQSKPAGAFKLTRFIPGLGYENCQLGNAFEKGDC